MPGCVTGLWTVILSAGGSTRLGRPKQLLRRRGKTLLGNTVEIAQTVTPGRIVAVVGAHPFRMRTSLMNCGTRVRIVSNARWRDGMAGSLRRGLEALPANATAVLLLLTDQPLVTAHDLERLIAAWARQPQRAAASRYGGRLGIPAVLPRRLWRDAKRASGDVGAREILRRPDAHITTVSLPAAGIDIDTEDDLAALSRQR